MCLQKALRQCGNLLLLFSLSLVVTHLQCQVHADVGHNELVLLRLSGKMEKGEVDARGGVVAGTILMQDVQAQGILSDCRNCIGHDIPHSLQ